LKIEKANKVEANEVKANETKAKVKSKNE